MCFYDDESNDNDNCVFYDDESNDNDNCVFYDDESNDNDITLNEKCKWRLISSSKLSENLYEIRNTVSFF